MLHITAFVQRLVKLKNAPNRLNYLNGLNRNYSFIHDNYSDKYDFNYDIDIDDLDEFENNTKGYWGYLRDKKADRNASSTNPSQLENNYDGYWGIFKDESSDNELSSGDEADEGLVLKNDDLSDNSNTRSFNYKISQLKIQAGKRDEIKMFIQSLEDEEYKLKKEPIKLFDIKKSNKLDLKLISRSNMSIDNLVLAATSTLPQHSSSNSSTQAQQLETKVKLINILYFSNSDSNNNELNSSSNLNNFKKAFNILSKLNKSINIFNGSSSLSVSLSQPDSFLNLFNVHVHINDLNSLSKQNFQSIEKSSAVSLCSNIYEDLRPFGSQNHSTMLFEHNNVKIGFMALFDEDFYSDLQSLNSNKPTEYVDFVLEANRLSKQLRLCGASLIIALVNMQDLNETRLINECADLDILLSSCNSADVQFKRIDNKWLIKSSNHFDSLALISLKLDQLNSNKIIDIAITKYGID